MAAKTDMERVALFKEMTYHTIGDPYVAPGQLQFNQSATKGKQLLPGGGKDKSALNVGYFSDFGRVFEGEGYADPVKMRQVRRTEEAKKRLGKDWIPSSTTKKPFGLGSYYGTFAGPIPHFEGIARGGSDYKQPGKNFYTNPGKLGTGYGYLGVTLGKYPEYKSEPYERNLQLASKENEAAKSKLTGKGSFYLNMHPQSYFDTNPYKGGSMVGTRDQSAGSANDIKPFRPSNPGKLPGGSHQGTFDPFPAHARDPYVIKNINRVTDIVNSSGKKYVPIPGPKSAPINSVLHQNILRSVNSQNYRTVSSIMSY